MSSPKPQAAQLPVGQSTPAAAVIKQDAGTLDEQLKKRITRNTLRRSFLTDSAAPDASAPASSGVALGGASFFS